MLKRAIGVQTQAHALFPHLRGRPGRPTSTLRADLPLAVPCLQALRVRGARSDERWIHVNVQWQLYSAVIHDVCVCVLAVLSCVCVCVCVCAHAHLLQCELVPVSSSCSLSGSPARSSCISRGCSAGGNLQCTAHRVNMHAPL
jgi:hypothetical protein